MDNIDFSKYLFDSVAEVEDSSSNLLVKPTNVIFFTINPSDCYWERLEDNYFLRITKEDIFRQDIRNVMENIQRYYKSYKNIKLDIHIHFEKTQRLHAHGVIIGMPEVYYPYGGELLKMSQRTHKVFGQPRLNSKICADFRWTNDDWDGSYIVKQNYLPPIRLIYT